MHGLHSIHPRLRVHTSHVLNEHAKCVFDGAATPVRQIVVPLVGQRVASYHFLLTYAHMRACPARCLDQHK
jgi:hypothetical protein